MDNSENTRRWRLMLGSGPADGTGYSLSDEDAGKDAALGALYEYGAGGGNFYGRAEDKSKGGRGASAPNVARWLGDIRKFFPQSTVQLLQRDAMKNESLREKMLLEPEILEQTIPDIHTVATLLSLGKLIPEKTKSTARMVVQKVVDELMEKLRRDTVSAIQGALHKAAKKKNPRYSEIDWHTTIRRNLKHYLPEYKTIIPEERIGFGRKMRNNLKDVVLCLDQSGSMGTSVVYSGIFGSVMASIPAVKTKMLVFDTQVVDLTEDLQDPVDLLFGVQLGGGTDINLALSKCQEVIERPDDTILVLITDLYEGGNATEMLTRVDQLVGSGVSIICLLALNDDGTPSYDHHMAKEFNQRNIPVFACTPDLFPEMMSKAIQKEDLEAWAAAQGIVVKKG